MADKADDSSHHEILGFNRRRAIITAIVAIILIAGVVALVGQVANFGDLLDAARDADKRWFPLCLLGELLAYAGYILAYRDAARVDNGPVFDYWTVTRVVGVGFGAFVVGSSAGGLAVDFWALHRAGVPVHEAARRVLGLNTLEWAVLAIFAFGSAVAVLLGAGQGAPLAMTLSWLLVVPACILAAYWVTSKRRVERFTRSPEAGKRPEGRHPVAWARWLWLELRKGIADGIGGVVFVRDLLAQPVRYWAGVIGYPIYWAGDLLALYAALRAFDAHIGLTPLILAYTTAYVLTALPLPAGGAGSIEAGLAFSLNAVGVPLTAGFLGAAVYRIFSFWLPIIPALALLPQAKRLNEELPRKQRQEEGNGDGEGPSAAPSTMGVGQRTS